MTNLSEHEMTVGLDAAAKRHLADLMKQANGATPTPEELAKVWDDMGAYAQQGIKQRLLSVVIATMEAVVPLVEQRVRLAVEIEHGPGGDRAQR